MKARKQTRRWTTKAGEKIRICDMADSHLLNSERMVRRIAANAINAEINAGYSALSCLNGEMAQYTVEIGISQLEHMEPIDALSEKEADIYFALQAEIDRRGLKALEA